MKHLFFGAPLAIFELTINSCNEFRDQGAVTYCYASLMEFLENPAKMPIHCCRKVWHTLNNNTEAYELYPHQFYCPKCLIKRPYNLKPISVKTNFYYIPLFEIDSLKHVVECKACKKGFDPRILKPDYQNLFKLAGTARREILKGSSLEVLKEELANAGLKEEFADKLIMLVQA